MRLYKSLVFYLVIFSATFLGYKHIWPDIMVEVAKYPLSYIAKITIPLYVAIVITYFFLGTTIMYLRWDWPFRSKVPLFIGITLTSLGIPFFLPGILGFFVMSGIAGSLYFLTGLILIALSDRLLTAIKHIKNSNIS